MHCWFSKWYTCSTSFPITCPSVSGTRGFLGKPGSNIENFYQALVIKFTSHLGGIQYLYNMKKLYVWVLKSTIYTKDSVKGGIGWRSRGKWTNMH